MDVIGAARTRNRDGAATERLQPEDRNRTVLDAGILTGVDGIGGDALHPVCGGFVSRGQLWVVGEQVEPEFGVSRGEDSFLRNVGVDPGSLAIDHGLGHVLRLDQAPRKAIVRQGREKPKPPVWRSRPRSSPGSGARSLIKNGGKKLI